MNSFRNVLNMKASPRLPQKNVSANDTQRHESHRIAKNQSDIIFTQESKSSSKNRKLDPNNHEIKQKLQNLFTKTKYDKSEHITERTNKLATGNNVFKTDELTNSFQKVYNQNIQKVNYETSNTRILHL